MFRLIPVLVLVGCGGSLTEEQFVDAYADSFCAKMFECGMGPTMGYADEGACRDEATTWIGAIAEVCEYDAEGGTACVDAIDAASCDDAEVRACDTVFSGRGCS